MMLEALRSLSFWTYCSQALILLVICLHLTWTIVRWSCVFAGRDDRLYKSRATKRLDIRPHNAVRSKLKDALIEHGTIPEYDWEAKKEVDRIKPDERRLVFSRQNAVRDLCATTNGLALDYQSAIAGRLSTLPDSVSKTTDDFLLQAEPLTSIERRQSEAIEIGPDRRMDHMYLNFHQYLWVSTLITWSSILGAFIGIAVLYVREALHKRGLLRPRLHPVDLETTVGRMYLETMLAVYCHLTHQNNDNELILLIDVLAWTDNQGNMKAADVLTIALNANTKRFKKGYIDGKPISAEQALIVAAHLMTTIVHPMVHSYANQAVDISPKQFRENPIFAYQSLATIGYNYFGATYFPTTVSFWAKLGLVSEIFADKKIIRAVLDFAQSKSVVEHAQITELAPVSRLVSFCLKTRKVFMSEFSKHKNCFPSYHGEAFFLGTVIHSLEHAMMAQTLQDPLWLDVNDPEFGALAQFLRYARVSFVEDIPFAPIERRFKDCPHPFYQNVYRKAATFDSELADLMDTCIIK